MLPLLSILFVDDDPTSVFLTQRVLARLGVRVPMHTTLSGEQALAWLQAPATALPELVFVNWNLANSQHQAHLACWKFISQFRHQYPQAATVTALLATHITEEDLRVVAATHAGPIFSKPLTDEKVGELLETHFLPLS